MPACGSVGQAFQIRRRVLSLLFFRNSVRDRLLRHHQGLGLPDIITVDIQVPRHMLIDQKKVLDRLHRVDPRILRLPGQDLRQRPDRNTGQVREPGRAVLSLLLDPQDLLARHLLFLRHISFKVTLRAVICPFPVIFYRFRANSSTNQPAGQKTPRPGPGSHHDPEHECGDIMSVLLPRQPLALTPLSCAYWSRTDGCSQAILLRCS